MSSNPYAAPAAEVADVVTEGEIVKAGRGTRLAAAIVDGLLTGAAAIPIGFAVAAQTDPDAVPALGSTALIISIVAILVLVVINIVLLHRNGQTIGKKLMDIKIVMVDGSRAGLGRIIALRILVMSLLGMIPLIGALVSLADPLFIFGEQRRCLHDYIAGTIVINT